MKENIATVVPRLGVSHAGRVHEIEEFSHYVGTVLALRYFLQVNAAYVIAANRFGISFSDLE